MSIRHSFGPCAFVMLSLLLAGPAAAKKNKTDVDLAFVPQQAVATVSATLDPAMSRIPVVFEIGDARGVKEPALIGDRTDDDDELFELRAKGDVLEFARKAILESMSTWGIAVRDDADLVLKLELTRFHVSERNQAVGATFNANVSVGYALRRRDGRPLVDGTATGAATRYGKKFSNDNCNEVLSDALLESLAGMLSGRNLHEAWSGRSTTTRPAESARAPEPSPDSAPMSPSRLLEEVLELKEQGFEAETLTRYVSGQKLTSSLGAEDLAAWKRAGIPEEVIRAAMACAVE